MKAVSIETLVALCVFSSVTSALPVIGSADDRVARAAEPQSYSVVPVDGGSSTPAPAPAATKTVTDAVTVSQVQTSVVLSTIIATPWDPSPATPTTPQNVTVVQTPPVATVEPSVTSIPYDNGQWHTTYYFRSTVTPSADNNAAVAPATSNLISAANRPTTTADLGQWAPWAQRTGSSWPGK